MLPSNSAVVSISSASIRVENNCSPKLLTSCTFVGSPCLKLDFKLASSNGCVNTFGPPYIAIRTASSGGTRSANAGRNIQPGFNARCIM